MPIEGLQDRIRELGPSLRGRPWGLFADIDGTLADVVASPEEAQVRPGCIRALRDLVRHFAVVGVVTGRDLPAARRMVGLDTIVYFCNHGVERWENGAVTITPEARQYAGRVKETAKLLEDRLALPGVHVEEKGYGLSVHYRNAQDHNAAESTIRAAIDGVGASQWMNLRTGKMLVDLRLPLNVSKGTALRALVEERSLHGAIALGDDTTDIDMFRAASEASAGRPIAYVNVAVLSQETPPALVDAATHTLDGVGAVEEFLLWLSDFLVTRRGEE